MKDYSNLDERDVAILNELQSNSGISNVELANRVNLSPPAVHARIKRLEQEGYIRGYVALLDRERLGFDMLCFIQISLAMHQIKDVNNFRELVAGIPEVLECHHLTGNFDYLLKVAVRNRSHLQQFLMENLTTIPYIARIQTSIALTEIKTTTVLPIQNGLDETEVD